MLNLNKEMKRRHGVAPTISVAMGVFNGSKYILDQLNSLVSQSYLPYELVVCDDCSTDGTFEILESFKKSAPFEVKLYRNDRNLGFANNFLRAASLCTGEWVSFCDQDDVWLADKLLNCANAIRLNECAFLILQNAYITDAMLNNSERVFPDAIKPGCYRSAAQYGFWVWPGFLQTFRLSLVRDLSWVDRPLSYYPGHRIQPHDKWTCMIGNALGGVVVLKEPVALYRRHAETVTGDYQEQKVKDRLAKSFMVSESHYRFLSAVAKSSANCLRSLAKESHNLNWRSNLLSGSKSFDRICVIQVMRAELYANRRVIFKLSIYIRILFIGGYIGPRMTAMGLMSALKDLMVLTGVVGYLSKSSKF